MCWDLKASDPTEPCRLFTERSVWRWQRKVLVWPVTEFYYCHGWWVERHFAIFPLMVFASLQYPFAFYFIFFFMFFGYKLSLPVVVSLSDGALYSGTAYNFLGSEPIISRYSPSRSLLRTEYSTSWLNGGFSVSVVVFTIFRPVTVPLGMLFCFSCRAQFCFCWRDQRRRR